jgi:uncharacterized membrane protein YdjX (TVP38/TMEM64 family)
MKGILLILLVLILFLSQFFWDITSFFSPENLQVWLSKAGSLAPLIFMLVMALAIVISPIPSLPLDIAAGAFFGPFWGTIYSSVGALGGAILSFLIARALGRDLILRLVGGHISFCTECSDKLLTKIVFLSRLLPLVSFDVVSYGAGFTKMSLSKFCLATYFGMLPLTFVYNYYGSTLTFGKELPILLGAIMVMLFFLLPRWIEKYDLFSLRKIFQHDQNHHK